MNLDDPMQIADRDPSGVLYSISTLPDTFAEASVIGQARGAEIGTPGSVSIVSDPPILGEILAHLASASTQTPIELLAESRPHGDVSLLIAIDLSGSSRFVSEAASAASPLSTAVLTIRPFDSERVNLNLPGNELTIDLPNVMTWDGGMRSVIAALSALGTAGVVSGASADIEAAIALMRRQSRAYAVPALYDSNAAKQLALLLGGRLPYLLGSTEACELIARYWRGRFSQYAKVMAVAAGYSDVKSEKLGWRHAIRQSEQWSVVAIRDRCEATLLATEFDNALDSINDDIPLHEVYADGDLLIERILGGMYYGEFVAGYLSLMWNEDPASN